MDQHLLVLTTFPDRDSAMACAQQLIRKKLAACVNVLPSLSSVYEWNNDVQVGEELLILIKTTGARYSQLEAQLRQIHPYELPEIIATPITHGFQGYLSWMEAQTAAVRTPNE